MQGTRILLGHACQKARRQLGAAIEHSLPDAAIHVVKTNGEGRSALNRHDFDAAVLEFEMAISSRDPLADLVRDAGLPFIVIAEHSDESIALQCMRAGAADMMPLCDATRNSVLATRIRGALATSAEGQRERRHMERRIRCLQRVAEHDALTGLHNRHAARRILRNLQAPNHTHSPIACVMLDLDHFKEINDSFGHAIGDQLLCQVAQLLIRHAHRNDVLIRWGGEEILALRPGRTICDTWCWAERIRRELAISPLRVEGREVAVTASFGVALCEAGSLSEGAIDRCDQAMYAAKENGRNRTCTVAMADLMKTAKSIRQLLATRKTGNLVPSLTRLCCLGPVQHAQVRDHSHAVCLMAREVAHQMGVGDAVLENLEIAAILHVIGKAAVPEDMLSKSQAYTSEETEFVKEHLRLGLDLCRTTTVSSAVTDILAHARGMIDDADSAAPNQQILVGGAILHMIDTFIAMTSNRPHRKRMSISEALDELRHACATPQDSEIVNVITSIGSRAETQDYRWAA